MVEDEKQTKPAFYRRRWVRWTLSVLGLVLLALVVFHAPILRAVIRSVAKSYAAGQNLKVEFRLEGDPLSELALRNVHATATGPSAIQSLDADTVKIDYSLWDLLFHGISDTLKNVEVHELTAVIDSSKAPVPTPTPTPAEKQRFSLPGFFPDRLEATNVNLRIKQQPQDMIVQDLNIGLYPDREGKLEIAKVQIPGVDTWTNIHGTTTYADKNLYLRNLTLDQNTRFETVNVNASKIGEGKLGIGLKGTLGGGAINSQTEISTSGPSTQAGTNLQARDISLGKLARYVGQSPGQLSGDVKSVDLELKGDLNNPATLNGNVKVDVENVHAKGLTFDNVKLDADAQNGQATIHEARIDQGNNHVRLHGSVDLPKKSGDFGRTPGNLEFTVDAPNLQTLTASMTPPVSGSLRASGNIKTEDNRIRVDAHATGAQVHYQDLAIGDLSADVTAEKKLPPPNEKKNPPFFEGLASSVQAQLSNVRQGNLAIEEVQATVKSNGAQVTLAPLTVKAGRNLLQANGSLQLPAPNEKLMDQPGDVQFTLNAPQLGEFWESGAPESVTGSMQGEGKVQIRKGIVDGQISVTGQEIAAQKLVVRQLDLQAAITHDVFHLKDLTATINDQDYLHAEGDVQLQKPYQYRAKATAHLADLSAFEPLLNAEGAEPAGPAVSNAAKPATASPPTQLAGSLILDWNGEGNLESIPHRGDLHLRLERGRYADLEKLEADVEAHYTPEQLDVPIVYLASDKFNLQASVQTRHARLEISNLQISQAKAKYASGYVAIPFEWSHAGTSKPLVPPNGKVQVNFRSENLDLAKLFRDLGKEPPVSGELTMAIDANGPVDQLQANVNLRMQNLEVAAMKQLEPARIDVGMNLQNNELKVAGKIQQPRIQPVQIDARLPLNVSRVIEDRQLDPQTPVTAKVQMPRSPINFVREFVPALRQLDGTLAMNVNIDGTIANPAFSGAADVEIVAARFENPTLPALRDFNARLNFRDNALRFDRFAGNLAGGPFTVDGAINFQSLTEPRFDLHLKADSVLVARNDNLTARVDADIKVEGPLKSAAVSGQVLTTNSRFLKNIDIIPIALPGRPEPHPEPPSAAPELSFPDPPLRDWKFDLTIKSKDPFLIRGNLATGRAIIDMTMTGTGLHPQLQGQVRLENFDATLPFSTLSINLGFVYFTPDDPLNPRLELQGTSLVRDYTIHVYVYGTANAPQAIFSSEPPLPQEEIISLLATGTTREELSSGNVLASRAGILLVKQLYRKIFKKGAEPETNDNSFFNRLDVEFGNTDPRTGEQTATARYKVSDHVVLIGDLGTQGGFRGLVKYLIRFR